MHECQAYLHEWEQTQKKAEAGDQEAIEKMALHFASLAQQWSSPEDRKRDMEQYKAILARWLTKAGGKPIR